MKRNLYIDCDGVIFNTVNFAFLEMKRLGIDTTNQEAITNYFKMVNWYYLILMGGVLNDSLNKIKTLIESMEFNLVAVETHRCSYNEGVVKDDIFRRVLPDIKVISVPKKIKKQWAVKAEGNFLIDDALDKVLDWIEGGGIGILYSSKTDHLIYPYELENNQSYFITNNLLDLLIINNYYKDKVYTR